jgi:hypothetical protein
MPLTAWKLDLALGGGQNHSFLDMGYRHDLNKIDDCPTNGPKLRAFLPSDKQTYDFFIRRRILQPFALV